MRIVIDTNVFVGACIGVGASNAVIKACFEHRFTPLIGASLLAEYESVLGRDALFTKSRLDASERENLLDIFWRFVSGQRSIICGAPICQTNQITT